MPHINEDAGHIFLCFLLKWGKFGLKSIFSSFSPSQKRFISGLFRHFLFIQTLHHRELIGRISILLSWLSVIIILACWNAFLDIRDAPWWYRIDVSSLWQTIFSTSIMDNYKRFALSEKNADKMPHKHYKFFIADFQSKFYLFTKSICHNL